MKLYLLITIDTECDKGPGWIIQRPMKYTSVLEAIPNLLNPLFEEFNIKPTYLLSPEIIQSNACVQVFKSCKNVELGTHLHGEFIEPEAFFDANRTSTPQLVYSPQVEFEKLQNLTGLFENQFGYSPTSFRAGRWGMSTSTLGFLEKLGYLVDSSVSPFKTHYFTPTEVVNFWGAPLQPYHPSTEDVRKKGNMKIIEMPATIGHPDLINIPRFLLRQLSDKHKVHKYFLRKLNRNPSVTWLRPYRSSAEKMCSLARIYSKKFGSSNDGVFLNMMFHSNELVVGGSPYVQTSDELTRFIESMRVFFKTMKAEYDVEGIGLSDVAKIKKRALA